MKNAKSQYGKLHKNQTEYIKVIVHFDETNVLSSIFQVQSQFRHFAQSGFVQNVQKKNTCKNYTCSSRILVLEGATLIVAT